MPKRKPKRQYTEAEKATALAALAANDGNVKRTARELGIPGPTLDDWRRGEGITVGVLEKQTTRAEALDTLFERVARLYLGQALRTEIVARSSGRDAVGAAAIALDKLRLLRGEATQIHDTIDGQIERELARLVARRTAALSEPAALPQLERATLAPADGCRTDAGSLASGDPGQPAPADAPFVQPAGGQVPYCGGPGSA
jgi:transposase-like protein